MRITFIVAALLAGQVGPGATAQPGTGSPELRLRFVNRSPDRLSEIYASPSGIPRWGKNLLGKRSLGPGQAVTLRVPGACGTYDLRLVVAGGKTEYLEEDVDLCSATAARRAALAGTADTSAEDEDDVVTVGGGALVHSKQPSPR